MRIHSPSTNRPAHIPKALASTRPLAPKPLDSRTASDLGRTTGHTLASIRVFADDPRVDALGTLALTRGRDIHLSPGLPGPEHPVGRRVRLHEGVHALQAARPGPAQPPATVERDADRVAAAAMEARTARPAAAADPASAYATSYDDIGDLTPADTDFQTTFALLFNQSNEASRNQGYAKLSEREVKLRKKLAKKREKLTTAPAEDQAGIEEDIAALEQDIAAIRLEQTPPQLIDFRFYPDQAALDVRRAYWTTVISQAFATDVDAFLDWLTGNQSATVQELIESKSTTAQSKLMEKGNADKLEELNAGPTTEQEVGQVPRTMDATRDRVILAASDEAKIQMSGVKKAMSLAGHDTSDFYASGYRSFDDQAGLYKGKAERERLHYRSAPGTSRHHWGAEFDLFSTSGDWTGDDELRADYRWLNDYAAYFGFVQPYKGTPEQRMDRLHERVVAGETVAVPPQLASLLDVRGYFEERWHWSYFPVTAALTDFAVALAAQLGAALEANWSAKEAASPKKYKYDFIRKHYLEYMFVINQEARFGGEVARQVLTATDVAAMSDVDLFTLMQHIDDRSASGAIPAGNLAFVEAEVMRRMDAIVDDPVAVTTLGFLELKRRYRFLDELRDSFADRWDAIDKSRRKEIEAKQTEIREARDERKDAW